jgi:hypothetical protein
MGRIDAFPTQQGANIARSHAGVGGGQDAQLLGLGEGSPLGDGNNLEVRAQGIDRWRAGCVLGICWGANLMLSVVHVGT